MWVCNIPVMRTDKSKEGKAFGGWMTSLAGVLCKQSDVKLAICYPQNWTKRTEKENRNEIIFYGFYVPDRCQSDKTVYPALKDIEKRFKPDLIHVFGTEFPHSLEALKLDPDRTLVDIQGLIGVYAEHYFLRIPASLTVPGVNRLTGKHISPIYENMLALKKRGVYEKSALKRARYVTGRTEWDLACMRYINPKAEYYACNRILRESFYGHEWKYNNVRKHSILISQADYPVKGFHIFLKALHLLRKKYSDIEVTVAGRQLNLSDPPKGTYDAYIREQIRRYHLEGMIHFTGLLDEREMCEQYLKTNVFVLPSLIENSPNSLGEAMIMGVPCVASNVGGNNNMLLHGVEGYLYQADAEYMLAYYLEEIFERQSAVEELSRNAKIRAEKTHDKKKNAQILLDIYRDIIRKNER